MYKTPGRHNSNHIITTTSLPSSTTHHLFTFFSSFSISNFDFPCFTSCNRISSFIQYPLCTKLVIFYHPYATTSLLNIQFYCSFNMCFTILNLLILNCVLRSLFFTLLINILIIIFKDYYVHFYHKLM